MTQLPGVNMKDVIPSEPEYHWEDGGLMASVIAFIKRLFT